MMGLGENARDKAAMMFDKMKVGATIKTSKGEFKKVDDKHFEIVGRPGRKFTAKQMTFIKEKLGLTEEFDAEEKEVKVDPDDSVAQIANKMSETAALMRSVNNKYKKAEGAERERLLDRLKELNQIKRELEGLL